MLPRRVAAAATVAATTLMATFAFFLHWPCRNTGYTDSRFTSLCYSDLASLFANPPLVDGSSPFGGTLPVEQAPIPAFILWLISQGGLGFLNHVIVMQIVLTAFMMWIAVMVLKHRYWRPLDAALVALTPLWPFVMWVSTDVISIAFAAAAFFAWHRNRILPAAIFSGLALASGAWTWVFLLGFLVEASRQERTRVALQVIGVAIGTALVCNLSRIFAGDSVLQAWKWKAGEGTPIYVWTEITGHTSVSNIVVTLAGLSVTAAIARWAVATPFDFRLELFIIIVVGVQLLTMPSIPPQSLTHLAFLIPVAFSQRKTVIGYSIPLIIYVIGVWMHFEAASPNGKGINHYVYGVLCIIMWVTVIHIMRRAMNMIRIQGTDEVTQSYAAYVRGLSNGEA
ncbi:MAG: hypothetical protein RL441_1421 [Actinomycetota bacterium]|jgi:hypothetical protein